MLSIVKPVSIFIAAILIALVSVVAQNISVIPECVERYARDLNDVMGSSGPVSIENLFEEGLMCAKYLEQGESERLDAPTFQRVKQMMRGFWVHRVEVVIAATDVQFFHNLANEKGTKVDKAFFELLKKTYPDPKSWSPIYEEQQTDFGGCFESGTFSDTYGEWIDFKEAYPERYQIGVQKEFDRIEAALKSTCICSGKDEYMRELESFMKDYPASPLAAEVASQLEDAKNRTPRLRFNCKSEIHTH